MSLFTVLQVNGQNSNTKTSSWGNNSFVNYNNPEWRSGYIRRDVERRNVFNWPIEYQRYSEMGPYEEASPYAPPGFRRPSSFNHGRGSTTFQVRHNTYHRGVYFDGYTYRNMRW